MEKRWLTQADVARMSRLSTSTISAVLAGRTGSIDTFTAIATALSVKRERICDCIRRGKQLDEIKQTA